MSDPSNWYVSDTHGAVHTGPGSQNNTFISLNDSEGRDPRQQAEDELRWLHQRFLPPAGFRRASEILESHRTVFLEASAGNGRLTTAKMLLRQGKNTSETLYELLPQERAGKPRLDPTHVNNGDRLWLDLTEVTREIWREVRVEFSSFRTIVQQRDARLVVVLPDKHQGFPPEQAPYRVRIEAPPRRQVLFRYLRCEGLSPTTESIQPPSQRFLRSERSLVDISTFVNLIVQAREHAGGGGNLAIWWATAEQIFFDQRTNVAETVSAFPSGYERALLLSVAMLHGAHVGGVHQALTSLLDEVGHEPAERSILAGTVLDQRLSEINADLDTSRRVKFKDIGFDAAVRTYLWTHIPGLHDHIPAWVDRVGDSKVVTDEEWHAMVKRFAEECLNDRNPDVLPILVEKWATKSASNRHLKAAALLLQNGLQNRRHGRSFRRNIYTWARMKNLGSGLAEVIITACREVMMIKHPDEALVRLHHVARRESDTRARDVLVEIASGSQRYLRRMLTRVTELAPEVRWPVDTDLFLKLAAPEALTSPGPNGRALITEAAIQRQSIMGWSIAFAGRPAEIWAPAARGWLVHAAMDEKHRQALLDVIVEGGSQHADVLAQLYTLAHAPDTRPVVSELLFQKINTVQGVMVP